MERCSLETGWAINPEVRGSKYLSASISFLSFAALGVYFSPLFFMHVHININYIMTKFLSGSCFQFLHELS